MDNVLSIQLKQKVLLDQCKYIIGMEKKCSCFWAEPTNHISVEIILSGKIPRLSDKELPELENLLLTFMLSINGYSVSILKIFV